MPREKPGHSQRSFSRKAKQPVRHRRVAWLTAFQPITVAGPRPIFTAFPAAHAYKLKIECMSRIADVSTRQQITTPGICYAFFFNFGSAQMCQRFFQVGFRFSTKARKPSCESS